MCVWQNRGRRLMTLSVPPTTQPEAQLHSALTTQWVLGCGTRAGIALRHTYGGVQAVLIDVSNLRICLIPQLLTLWGETRGTVSAPQGTCPHVTFFEALKNVPRYQRVVIPEVKLHNRGRGAQDSSRKSEACVSVGVSHNSVTGGQADQLTNCMVATQGTPSRTLHAPSPLLNCHGKGLSKRYPF